MIDDRSFNRITNAMEEAQERGATLVQLIPGRQWDAEDPQDRPPHGAQRAADCELRTREIFGPVLPIMAVQDN
jgi:coniferyl-aldehyde dehydrogenase